MDRKLDLYVGRIVRLNQLAFREIRNRAMRQGLALENSFLVAAVNRKLQRIICYGASFRIVVKASDVVLV